ncbi:MAG: aromatic-ring-hydroxylating dioxygenase subunit beta [Pigmentiphaga sp.]
MNMIISPKDVLQTQGIDLATLRDFVEYECSLLDEMRFSEWHELFAEDGIYWVPAKPGQESGVTHVSLFFDDKPTIKTRVTRLQHPQIHCQDPLSQCVRVVSSVRLVAPPINDVHTVSSRFVMLEDRVGAPQRLFGGRYLHTLRSTSGDGLEIVEKRVELTNCDQSFPMLTQPF